MRLVGIVAALALSVLLSACGDDRSVGPPDAVLPLVTAEPGNQAQLGEVVDVVFEVVDAEPDLSVSVGVKLVTPPYRVESQLMVLARVDQEFMAQGIWRGQQVTVHGILRAMNEKSGTAPLRYTYEFATVSGPHKSRTRAASSVPLKPYTPTQLGGVISDPESGRHSHTLVVWIRPHVTPGQAAPLLKQP